MSGVLYDAAVVQQSAQQLECVCAKYMPNGAARRYQTLTKGATMWQLVRKRTRLSVCENKIER